MNIVLCQVWLHVSLIFLLVFVFESSDGVKDLVSGLTDGDGSHLSAVIDSSGQGVNLADCEPGEGREHEVEQVLSDVDHDVLVLEDSLFDDLTKMICYEQCVRSRNNCQLTGPRSTSYQVWPGIRRVREDSQEIPSGSCQQSMRASPVPTPRGPALLSWTPRDHGAWPGPRQRKPGGSRTCSS